jgi:hypothetical protein
MSNPVPVRASGRVRKVIQKLVSFAYTPVDKS